MAAAWKTTTPSFTKVKNQVTRAMMHSKMKATLQDLITNYISFATLERYIYF